MKILVLGGTGAMGEHLVRLLEEDGADIFVTSRSSRTSRECVHYMKGDAKNPDFLWDLLREHWDVIIDFMAYSTAQFQARISELLDAAGQYVFLSSARVYAESESPITENTPRLLDVSTDAVYLKTDEYALAKARQEDLLKNSGRKNWTVVRPSITFSEIRLQLGCMEKEAWIYRVLHGRSLVFSEDIADKLTAMTYGEDVAAGIKSLIGNPSALGEFFHITSEEAFRWREILELYSEVFAERLGRRPRIVMTKKSTNLRIGRYQVIYCRVFNRRFDNGKIKRLACVPEFRKTKEALRACLEDFLSHPKFSAVNWRLEAMNDRAAGEWTPLSEIPSSSQKTIYLFERIRAFWILRILRKICSVFGVTRRKLPH